METDKDGGFAVMPSYIADQGKQSILTGGDYEYGNVDKQRLACDYRLVCKDIGKFFGIPGLSACLNRSMADKSTAAASILKLNCKTHKSPVSFRNIHASTHLAVAGLSLFVADRLQDEINKFSHVVKGTKDVVKQLSLVTVCDSQRFCLCDVEHFFMSGNAFELAETSAKVFAYDKELEALMRHAILFLLLNQFVVCENITYRVRKGSGMGLPHSSGVAEAALLMGSEVALINDLRSTYMVDMFVRFKDDVLIIFNSLPRLKDLMSVYRAGHPFVIKCEQISTHSIKFLEITIEKQRDGFIKCLVISLLSEPCQR